MKKQTARRDFLSTTSLAVAGGATLATGAVPASAQTASVPSVVSRRPTLGNVVVLFVGGGPAGIGAAAVKSMGNCMATGHAAGSAAATRAKKNCQPRELKVAELQAALCADGVDLAAKDRTQTWLK